jgi:hypothetical protein
MLVSFELENVFKAHIPTNNRLKGNLDFSTLLKILGLKATPTFLAFCYSSTPLPGNKSQK